MDKLIMVYLSETDGDVVLEEVDGVEQINTVIAKHNLSDDDFALFGGVVLKEFAQKIKFPEMKRALEIMKKNKKYKQ